MILEFLLITVVLTFLLLLFGEIMPKIYSAQNTLKFCRKAAPAISFKEILFTFVGIAGPFFLFGEQMCGKKEL